MVVDTCKQCDKELPDGAIFCPWCGWSRLSPPQIAPPEGGLTVIGGTAAIPLLDIACGQRKQPGATGIDIAECEGVDIVHDLNNYPWPIDSDSVQTAMCSHYIEHIPMIHVQHDGRNKDALLAFFDEVYRILVPEGQLTILVPYYTSVRCWQDPTHRRAINENTLLYTWKHWRVENKVDHYNVSCDFDFAYGYSIDPVWSQRPEETQRFALRHYNNVAWDMQATLTKKVGR